jgi:hypothetical protein
VRIPAHDVPPSIGQCSRIFTTDHGTAPQDGSSRSMAPRESRASSPAYPHSVHRSKPEAARSDLLSVSVESLGTLLGHEGPATREEMVTTGAATVARQP